ncbi:MAG: DUF2779 domain-containing protein [Bacteroidales bacterium]|nr:DUF2779 domain-containing protein [Bacteroidales bacterium]
MKKISKSSYLKGNQCEKALFLHINHPELKDEISEEQQARFDIGHNIGKLAQQLFPGGIDASRGDFFNYDAAITYTSELIDQGQEVIYEAAFMAHDRLCYLDILVREDGKWKAYEVKASTSVKNYHYQDSAFQYWVITNAGLSLEDISIVHINNQYTRQGRLELDQLFTITSVVDQAKVNQLIIEQKSKELLGIMNGKIQPTIDIGPHCSDPFGCDFHSHCWKHVPEYSVFNISGLRAEKKFNLYQKRILEFKEIPLSYPLNANQWLQVNAELNNKTIRNQPALDTFKAKLSYPLCFMDFETFQLTVPQYDNTRPYQLLPFQYSLHIKKSPNASLEHKEYLGTPPEDPRPGFIQQLINDLGTKGSIVVYNHGFESARLRELARDFPKYHNAIQEVLSRIVDLMEPFRKRDLYTPEMRGSYSIKYVLPALVPSLSYKDLEVQNGGMASLTYASLYNDGDGKSVREKRDGLLEYCKLDTLAMVEILKVLES